MVALRALKWMCMTAVYGRIQIDEEDKSARNKVDSDIWILFLAKNYLLF